VPWNNLAGMIGRNRRWKVFMKPLINVASPILDIEASQIHGITHKKDIQILKSSIVLPKPDTSFVS
jgi:hypothetical protein